MREKIIILLFCFLSNVGISQETFQRIYLYQDTFATAHGVFVTDTCYYFGATSGSASVGQNILLGKMNLQGDIDFISKYVTPFDNELPYGVHTFLDTNYRGNFILGYTNRNNINGSFPKIVEMDKNGAIVNEKVFDFFYDDSLNFFDNGTVLMHDEDSSYYCFFSYADRSTDSNPSIGFDGELGAMLFKVNNLGDTLWTKKFRYATSGFGNPYYYTNTMIRLPNDKFLLSLTETKQYGTISQDQDIMKVHFYIVDLDGNTLGSWVFQDTQSCYGGFSILPLADGSIIHSYFESELTGTPPNNDYFWFRPVISRLDANFQQIWRDTLVPRFANLAWYATPYHLQAINDTVFAGAYTWYGEKWDNIKSEMTVRLFNRHIDGQEIWNRDYRFFPIGDTINEPEYWLYDMQLTPDGGYIACGEVKNFDSLNTGGPGQYAYFLKTNCLGFLGDPQTSASYSFGDSLDVFFVNESVQAGSYTWIFGDGDTLRTSEYIDSLTHFYSIEGNYDVQLIAYGCNGANDTLNFTITVPKIPDDTIVLVGDGTLLTIYPNPISSGETLAFYVGNISNENITFDLITETGQLVYSASNIQGESTYILPIPLSGGMYFASLREGGKRLEAEKVVVR